MPLPLASTYTLFVSILSAGVNVFSTTIAALTAICFLPLTLVLKLAGLVTGYDSPAQLGLWLDKVLLGAETFLFFPFLLSSPRKLKVIVVF